MLILLSVVDIEHSKGFILLTYNFVPVRKGKMLRYLLLDLYRWLSVSLCYACSRSADGRRAYAIESVASRPDRSANKGFWLSLNIVTVGEFLYLLKKLFSIVLNLFKSPRKPTFMVGEFLYLLKKLFSIALNLFKSSRKPAFMVGEFFYNVLKELFSTQCPVFSRSF